MNKDSFLDDMPLEYLDEFQNSAALNVPVPQNEGLRLKVLKECGLLDSSTRDSSFDRYTSLCQRLFKVK